MSEPSPSASPALRRATAVAIWLLPVLFFFWLYRNALHSWFWSDDFAWLTLLHSAEVRHDFLHEMFSPMAQGTIRPWSERGFFMALQGLFGLDSRPFRIVVFLTASADLLLITWITRRATASKLAGFVAPVLWTANTALVLSVTWNSAYNEVMCPLFLLAALALFIRYVETGRKMFWWCQLAAFVFGFGALEINIVYPAIAAGWVLFVAAPPSPNQTGHARQSLLRSLLPLVAISVAYFLLHTLVAPLQKSGPYALRFDASILKTFALYCKWTLVPEPMARFGAHRRFAPTLVLLTGAIAVAGFIVTEFRQRRYAIGFFLTWFIATLAPVLPLANHRTDYYLTIPAIGIAMLGGAAAGHCCRSMTLASLRAFLQSAVVAIPIAVYLWAMIPVTRAVTDWWLIKSLAVRTLVLGARSASQTHPGKAIVLDAVTTDLFNFSLAHSAFRAAGLDDVYLTPESGLSIIPASPEISLDDFVLDPNLLRHAVTHDDVVVYSLESDHLRNITEGYTRRLLGRTVDQSQADLLPTRLDVGNTLYSWLLGPTWLPPESGVRWMPGSATFRIGVPAAGGRRLELTGHCPESQLLVAPRHLIILADGDVVGDTRIYDPESSFHRLFPMPDVFAGKSAVELEIRVDPVERKDDQDYGLIFGKIAVLP